MQRLDPRSESRARVLVVEDDASTRAFVKTTLARDGHQVVLAATFGAGAELVRDETWDLILLDLRLRDGVGIELLPEIRRRETHTPVLVLTGVGRTKEEIESLDRGADDFLSKPVSAGALRARVRSLIRQGTLRRELAEANRFYHRMLEGMGDALVVLDAAGVTVAANGVAMRLLLDEQPLGRPATEIFGPDLAREVLRIGDSLVLGESRTLEAVLPRPRGTVIDLLISRIGTAGEGRVMVVGRDRSREHHLGESVSSTNEFLHSLVTQSADAIVATTPEGMINFFSPGAVEIFGWEQSQVRGTAVEHYYAGGRETARQVMNELRCAEKTRNRQVRFLCADGGFLDASLSASLLRDRTGTVIGTVGVVKDVSGERRAEKERLRKEALAARGALAAQIGHQMRNMLAVMQGRTQLARRKLVAGEVDRAARDLQAVEDEVAKLAAVAEDLMSSRRRELGAGPVELGGLLGRLVESLAETERFHGHPLLLGQPKTHLHVEAPARAMETVVTNLLENAADASPAGGEIEIRCRGLAVDRARIEVLDRGPGVPEGLHEKILSPHFTTKAGGHGLGLPLVKRLLGEIGGELCLEGRSGGGMVFRVDLPLSAVDEALAAPPSG